MVIASSLRRAPHMRHMTALPTHSSVGIRMSNVFNNLVTLLRDRRIYKYLRKCVEADIDVANITRLCTKPKPTSESLSYVTKYVTMRITTCSMYAKRL